MPEPQESLLPTRFTEPSGLLEPGSRLPDLETALDLAAAGERLSRAHGLVLLREAPLTELGRLAAAARSQRTPPDEVTFLIDSNPNYTNVCVTDCGFCAFYRKPGEAGGYTLSVEQVMEKVALAAAGGATTVLLQGGHNPELPLDYYLDLVRETRRRFPGITPHYFTASEVVQMAQVSGLTLEGVLQRLRAAGQVSLPGGGAEVLSDRVRRKVAAKKGPSSAWLNVHRAAHLAGMRSTVTMMYGHLEEDEDILVHLDSVRALQDETAGFTAFIPWSYKPGNTPMQRTLESRGFRPAGAATYLRIIALARLYLDNFEHIQASWFGEGKKTGQVALHFGADDFGGTLIEENVHLATGHNVHTSVEETKTLIREAGFVPVQRTTLYERVRRSDEQTPEDPRRRESA
jgi:cyclic dehypoxanthinyl futalosine synthase